MGSGREGKGGMVWENGIETCILYVEWIASPGSMLIHGARGWCTGMTRPEHHPKGWDGEGVGTGVQEEEHMYTRGGFMSLCGKTNKILQSN